MNANMQKHIEPRTAHGTITVMLPMSATVDGDDRELVEGGESSWYRGSGEFGLSKRATVSLGKQALRRGRQDFRLKTDICSR
jgi:hypothetical protein